ncbi:MAG: transporter substrate-binding domain-containing protein [Leptospiraceae bacterium]|nr:transporter substrate-binding domain-containing protein [Leptospiraceae bacterium]
MNLRKKIITRAFLLLLITTPFVNLLSLDKKSVLYRILKKKKLTVSVGANYEPYYIDNPKPGYPGFEVEIAEKYADYLGVEIEKILPLNNFSEHALAVNQGIVDLALGNSSSMIRMKYVYFSDPYLIVSVGGLVNKMILPPEQEGDIVLNKNFRSLLDLKSLSRLSFGVKEKTSNLDYIKSIYGQNQIMEFKDDFVALEALKDNKFNTYVADNLYIEGLMQKDSSLKARFVALSAPIMEKQVSFCFKKYDLTTQADLNLFIREIKRTGEVNRLKEKYFNSNKWVK